MEGGTWIEFRGRVHIITCRALSTARCDRWAILGPPDGSDKVDCCDWEVY